MISKVDRFGIKRTFCRFALEKVLGFENQHS